MMNFPSPRKRNLHLPDHIIPNDEGIWSIFYGDTPNFFIDDSEVESSYEFCYEVEMAAAMLGVTVDYYLLEFV